jgi:5-oxoprolinase (ATP-hydrolysing)
MPARLLKSWGSLEFSCTSTPPSYPRMVSISRNGKLPSSIQSGFTPRSDPSQIHSVHEIQEPSSAAYEPSNLNALSKSLDRLALTVSQELQRQGFAPENIKLDRILNMRFEGTDTTLLISCAQDKDFGDEFRKAYKEQFGFTLETPVVIDDIKVKGIGKTFDSLGESVFAEFKKIQPRPVDRSKIDSRQSVFVSPPGVSKGRREQVPVYELGSLDVGDAVDGPALIIDATQTVFVNS